MYVEEAYVLAVSHDSVTVLVPRFSVEGLIRFSKHVEVNMKHFREFNVRVKRFPLLVY